MNNMTATERFSCFCAANIPMAAIDGDGQIVFRNRAALDVSGIFRMKNNIRGRLRAGVIDECVKERKAMEEWISVSEKEVRSVLLLPCREEEVTIFLMIGEKCEEMPAECIRDEEISAEEVRAFANAVFPSTQFETLPFTVKYLCLYLNRFSAYHLEKEGRSVTAKCTADCIDFPVARFAEITACLSCISLLLLKTSEDRHLDCLVYCEHHRIHIEVKRNHTYELHPDAARQLAALYAVCKQSGWDVSEERHGAEARTVFSAIAECPARQFRNDDLAEKAIICAVEKLIRECF